MSRTGTTVGNHTPTRTPPSRRLSGAQTHAAPDYAATTAPRKHPHRSRFWPSLVAVVAGALIAATAFAAPARAEVVAFYMPGTSPHPVSSGTVGASAIGAAANGWITQVQQVGYPASLQPAEGTMALDASVAQGVANLAAAVAAVPTAASILLFGVSQGDIVLTYEERALIAAGHPNNITFIRIADPSGPTGIMGRNAGLVLPGTTFVRAPNDSPYNTVVIVHQYDFFADWPAQQLLNPLADINAIAGGFLFHNYAGYNVDLSTIPASDVTTTVNSKGATTTTYFIRATGLLPMLVMMHNAGVSSTVVNALQPILKPVVDSGYAPLPSPAAMARNAFHTVTATTAATRSWAARALRGTRATLAAAAARLAHTTPASPRPGQTAPTAALRQAAPAPSKPTTATKPSAPQATSTPATGALSAPASTRQRTTHLGNDAAISPSTRPRTTPAPVSSRKPQ